MNQDFKLQGGLRQLTKDKRDFDLLGGGFILPELSELPDEFELPILGIKDQGETDFCSAFTTCTLSEIQEGIKLYPPYSFAISKLLSKNPDAWGQTMRHAMKAHVKRGAIEESEVSDTVRGLSQRAQRYFESYPKEYIVKAKKHLKKSYFKVTGQYDDYDNIRAAIWKFREDKQGVAIGLLFGWSLKRYILDILTGRGFGHMMAATGWKEEGLIVVNSYGLTAGKEGKHLVTRKVINEYVKKYGAMMIVDIDPDEVRRNFSLWEKIKRFFL